MATLSLSVLDRLHNLSEWMKRAHSGLTFQQLIFLLRDQAASLFAPCAATVFVVDEQDDTVVYRYSKFAPITTEQPRKTLLSQGISAYVPEKKDIR